MKEINITQKSNTQEGINMENPSIPQPSEETQINNEELQRIKTGYNQHAIQILYENFSL